MLSCFRPSRYLQNDDYHDGAAKPPAYYTAAVDTTGRIAALRGQMAENKIDAYLIPSSDAHGSEYVADKDRRQLYMSAFSGEASTAILGRDEACLFVDGRYHVQAEKEIDSNWTLYKVGLPDVKTWYEYVESLPSGTRIGLDARLYEISVIHSLQARLAPKDIQLVYLSSNLVDAVWTHRPAASTAPLILQAQYAGQSSSSKLSTLRKYISDNGAAAYIVSNLAEIAWLLNLRGADIPFSPVFESYLLVSEVETTLFIDDTKITDEITRYLKEEIKVQTKGYGEVWDTLEQLKIEGRKCLMSTEASFALYNAISAECALLIKSPIELAKSIKNPTEIAGMKAAYLRDGIAWTFWMARLEARLRKGGNKDRMTEWDAANELTSIRKVVNLYAGLAYENISATAGNAALPHYSATKETAAVIDTATPYLNDSGANYRDGTIDNTRTYHFGKPTAEHKRAYTRVLQGHIQCASTTFPAGTTGAALDSIARRALWQDGLNYLHGTGHGIDSYLNVHSGPQRIASVSSEPLRPGQMVSVEPGYYETDKFGIRIESIYLVKEVETQQNVGGKWLGFERITQVPIDTKMVDWKLLSKEETHWLKIHNAQVVKTLLKEVPEGDKQTRRWLSAQTL